jgi:two-component system OmpR family sensor kinase
LGQVARLVVDEFKHDPRLKGRMLTAEGVPVRVRADLDAVGLAVRNVVENALTHGHGGRYIRVSSVADGDPALIVTDDGPGVDPAQLPALTQRFVRGQGAEGSGAGLGLSIVATLARRLGARLVLESPPPGVATGLEVSLIWPRTDGIRGPH